MHGVPDNLPLAKFHGLSLLAVRPLENITYFDFGREGQSELEIGVEGRWEVRGNANSMRGNPIPSDLSTLRAVVGSRVTGSQLRAPESFVLELEGAHELEVFDSNDQHESFSIPQWGIYI